MRRVARVVLSPLLLVTVAAVTRADQPVVPGAHKHFARVSVAPGGRELRGGAASLASPAISGDGKVVAFPSLANNLAPTAPEISPTWSGNYLKDLTSAQIELLPGTAYFYKAAISADGRYVAYQDVCKMVRYDRVTGERRRVDDPAAPLHECYMADAPSISADGRYIAFTRRHWVTDPGEYQQVYRYDAVTNTVELVSHTQAGVTADRESFFAGISGDGSVVAYMTAAPALGASLNAPRVVVHDFDTGQVDVLDITGPSSGFHPVALDHSGNRLACMFGSQAWIHDRAAGTTVPITTGSGSLPGDTDDGTISIDATGRRVVLTAPDPSATASRGRQILLYAVDQHTIRTLGIGLAGAPPNGRTFAPTISRDGSTVVFMSEASNLIVDDTNGLADAFTIDLASGVVRRVSSTSTGVQAMGGWGTQKPAAISGDGRTVVYLTAASNAADRPLPQWGGEFVLDRKKGRVRMVSVGHDGTALDIQRPPAISDDGRYVLIPGAGVVPSGDPLAFASVLDLDTGTPHPVFLPPGQNGYLTTSMSRDGSVVAFVGPDPFVPGTGSSQIYRCTVSDGQCTRISRALDGGPADNYCEEPVVSSDGRFIAFFSTATNLAGGATGSAVYVYDHQSATLERVSIPPPEISGWSTLWGRPSISADGRLVAFATAYYVELPGQSVAHQDVFVRDRQLSTTTLVSMLPDGSDNPWSSREPSLSADGRYVAFVSLEHPDQTPPGGSKIYVHDRTTHETSLALPDTLNGPARWPTLSADGKHLVFVSDATNLIEDDTNWAPDVFVLDLEPTLAIKGVWPPSIESGKATPVEIRGSGFQASAAAAARANAAAVPTVRIGGVIATDVRVISDTLIVATMPPVGSGTDVSDVSIDFGAPELVAELPVSVGRVPTVGSAADADGDGMSDAYELAMGFDAAIGNSSEDADGDGIPNGTEYARGTHPGGGRVQGYLAEGATGAFKDYLALLNPGSSVSRVLVKAQTATGARIVTAVALQPTSRATLEMGTIAGLEAAEFSTVVEATGDVLFSRALVWGDGEGSHAETAIPQPAPQWIFAEGATHSGMQLFYLLQNPNSTPAHVTARYLKPAPGGVVTRTFTIDAARRFTIWANTDAETNDTDLSAVFTSDVPIIAERAIYRDAEGVPFAAGHESAGVPTPATAWFLAEGATGSYLDLFVLIANPGTRTATCTVRFLLPDGTVIPRQEVVAPTSRDSIWVDTLGGRLSDTAVSTHVACDEPVVVERAMWWPGDASTWTEAHDSVGAVTTGTRWAVPDGEQGGTNDAETYILIANTSDHAGAARVTLMFEDGSTVDREVVLPANSRTNVSVGAPAQMGGFGDAAVGRRFGAIVDALDTGAGVPQIVVERSIYASAHGRPWAAGTNALGTKLQ